MLSKHEVPGSVPQRHRKVQVHSFACGDPATLESVIEKAVLPFLGRIFRMSVDHQEVCVFQACCIVRPSLRNKYSEFKGSLEYIRARVQKGERKGKEKQAPLFGKNKDSCPARLPRSGLPGPLQRQHPRLWELSLACRVHHGGCLLTVACSWLCL